MNLMSFVLDLTCLIASMVTLWYIFKIDRLLKNFTFRFLKMAFLYAMFLRGFILLTYFDGVFSINEVGNLMAIFWILLSIAFYENYTSISNFIYESREKGG